MRKVMLAANTQPNLNELDYPVLVSGKLDGVRGVVQEGKLVSRSLKESINRYVSAQLSRPEYEGLDGELTVTTSKWNDFNTNQSAFMTQSSMPSFVFHVFDDINSTLPAAARKEALLDRCSNLANVKVVPQHFANSAAEVIELYKTYRAKGYEGIIICDPKAAYKHGRSTLKQGIMLKMKPTEDSEAVITGVEPVQHNLDAGNSTKKENMVEGDRAGVILASWNGKAIRISGFDHSFGKDLLDNFEKYKGKIAKFKYMELTTDGMPRHPIFLGIRSKDDM